MLEWREYHPRDTGRGVFNNTGCGPGRSTAKGGCSYGRRTSPEIPTERAYIYVYNVIRRTYARGLASSERDTLGGAAFRPSPGKRRGLSDSGRYPRVPGKTHPAMRGSAGERRGGGRMLSDGRASGEERTCIFARGQRGQRGTGRTGRTTAARDDRRRWQIRNPSVGILLHSPSSAAQPFEKILRNPSARVSPEYSGRRPKISPRSRHQRSGRTAFVVPRSWDKNEETQVGTRAKGYMKWKARRYRGCTRVRAGG